MVNFKNKNRDFSRDIESTILNLNNFDLVFVNTMNDMKKETPAYKILMISLNFWKSVLWQFKHLCEMQLASQEVNSALRVSQSGHDARNSRAIESRRSASSRAELCAFAWLPFHSRLSTLEWRPGLAAALRLCRARDHWRCIRSPSGSADGEKSEQAASTSAGQPAQSKATLLEEKKKKTYTRARVIERRSAIYIAIVVVIIVRRCTRRGSD